ncbi:MAG: hypothetical protein SOV79_03450 [Eisenbergiella porci]|uniref:hypothetical protein n=1 Tax=Eisenbergiella porci TaxID=2652274 RepID=UPI002A75BF44|nr:hypothetical protein [Eisenbergiella porci]MDY2651643.1 hypothetical protein [Eisenbergiella porci]
MILIEDTGNLKEIIAWVKKGIEEIQDLVDFWNVDLLDGSVEQTDVGILPFQIINQQDKVYWLDEFLDKVSFAAVLEASDILAGGQEAVAALAEKVGRKTPRCTWFLCDKNAESMVDLFSHLLNSEIKYVSATPYYAKKTMLAYWNTESEPFSPWKPAKRYLGVEARIAEIAGKEHISHLIWYGEDVMPVYDLQWIFGQYYDLYGKRTGEKPYQMQLNSRISFEISGNANKLETEQFLLVEDSNCNLFELGRQFATRAQEKIFVNILSPDYMLRDYMKSIKDVMNADPKYITQFVPLPVNTMRNVALRLIRRMLEGEISEEEIWEFLKKGEEDVKREFINLRYLQKLINLVFNIDDAEISINFGSEFSNQEKEIKQIIYYRIVDERVKKEFRKYFSQASYIDEIGDRKYIGKLMLAGHLEQKYMKGQQVVLNGKYYVITGKNQSEYGQELLVRRASDQIYGRKYYRQLRRYFSFDKFDEIPSQKIVFRSHQVVLKRCHINLNAYSYGYLEMDSWNQFYNENRILGQFKQEETRIYRRKEALQVEFTGKMENKRLIYWTAIMLKETFCTFYPQYYHLLDVAVNYKEYREYEIPQELLTVILSHIDADTTRSFYILEDSREDMGLLRSIESNFTKIMKIIQDYVKWSKDNGDNYFGK